MLAILMVICMIPVFNGFADDDDFGTIDSPEEFAAFTKAVNEGTYSPYGDIITVTADLDMRNITDFQPINVLNGFDLDFQGHTVYNLVVNTNGATTSGATEGSARFAGIIAHNVKDYGSIVNLNLYNCMLTVDARRAGLVAGYVNCSVVNNITVENCTVNAAHTDETKQRIVGGVVSNIDYSYENYVMNATVKNLVIESTGADTLAAVVGEIWKGQGITVGTIKAEDVLVKNGGEVVQVDAVPASGATVPEGVTVTVTNNPEATGYSDTPVDGAQIPERPVLAPITTTPVTTAGTPTTTKAPTTTTPTTTAPATTVPATTVANEEKGGCKGFAGASVAFVALMTVAGCTLLKKKED